MILRTVANFVFYRYFSKINIVKIQAILQFRYFQFEIYCFKMKLKDLGLRSFIFIKNISTNSLTWENTNI